MKSDITLPEDLLGKMGLRWHYDAQLTPFWPLWTGPDPVYKGKSRPGSRVNGWTTNWVILVILVIFGDFCHIGVHFPNNPSGQWDTYLIYVKKGSKGSKIDQKWRDFVISRNCPKWKNRSPMTVLIIFQANQPRNRDFGVAGGQNGTFGENDH